MRKTSIPNNRQPFYKPTSNKLRKATNLLEWKESDIQKAFCHRIKIKKTYNQYPIGDFEVIATCNEHLGGVNIIRHYIAMGLLPGVFDLMVLVPNSMPAFMETKRNAKEKLRPSQVKFRDMCIRYGYEWTVYWDVEQGDEWLTDYLRRKSQIVNKI